MINFYILTLFPEMLMTYAKGSILGRAERNKLIKINFVNFRKYAEGRHKTVDEKAYGGGPGMVLKIEPIYKAVKNIKKNIKGNVRVILFSTRGKKFDQKNARRLSKYKNIVLICGRYEGVDERVARYIADEEISIGDFVLSGGELPAMILVETISRYVPGVLGKYESLEEIKGFYPVYTRPEIFKPDKKKRKTWKAPKVLLSGDHAKISKWRNKF
ncbi:MAG: tRNA (guanosine(37)-N1)-methyltransferase TrmD [Patescibacteria group bacterium]|nr:tRNA (guanosine(37)-N1)-methyltransferase TrmD [Patescibacteria group bacterium]